MGLSWITLYPEWYIHERALLSRHYPGFRVDERALGIGHLIAYGELVVRPPGGAKRHPVRIAYPEGTPFEHPIVTPITQLPEWNEDGGVKQSPAEQIFDRRHQMPGGALCLFQRETRAATGGDVMDILQVLRRVEQWFAGHHTGRWPPDTEQSELESHFPTLSHLLVEDTFFAPDLVGHGRMFFALDLRRQMEMHYQRPELRGYRLMPMVLTCVTKETGIVESIDARAQLSRVCWWIEDAAWDATKLAEAPDLSKLGDNRLQHGYWWSLPEEPMPFHDGKGLIQVLSSASPDGDGWRALSQQLRGDLSVSPFHIIGLKYPGRDGGYEWLVCVFPGNARQDQGGYVLQTDADKRAAFEWSPVWGCIRTHRLEPSALRLRNTGVVDNSVTERSALLIGLGALGSEVAELLAKAGIGKFYLCDSDCLMTSNVTRHLGGVGDFGKPKTDVVRDRILEINPYLEFGADDIVYGSAVGSLDRLASMIASADLTICTTADESVESVVNQIAVIKGKPVLYGRSMRRASVGRIFLVQPGNDACKCCLADYAIAGREGRESPNDWIDVCESEDDILLHECGRPVIASSAIDLSFIAGLTARIALDVLEGRAGDQNHWVWTKAPAPDIDERLGSGLCTFVGRIDPRPGCPACQEPEVTALVLADEALAAITQEAESSPDRETGGVLIGFVDDQGRAIALRATGPGPDAVRERDLFKRDVPFIQSELDRAAAELNDRGSYIGEWHTHLTLDLRPSPIDIDSLFGVSRAPNYLTRCPCMMIVGVDPETGKAANREAWVFPIGGRMYRAGHTGLPAPELLGLRVKANPKT